MENEQEPQVMNFNLTDEDREWFKNLLTGQELDPVSDMPIRTLVEEIDRFDQKMITKRPGCRSLNLDTRNLSQWNPQFYIKFLNNGPIIIDEMTRIFERVLIEKHGDDVVDNGYFHVRPVFYLPDGNSGFNDMNAGSIGKLVTVRGVVTAMTAKSPHPKTLVFKCATCSHNYEMKFDRFSVYYPPPAHCTNPQCPNFEGKVKWNLETDSSRFVDFQYIFMQEEPEFLKTGQQPRDVKVAVTDDIVMMAKPGSRIVLTGIVIATPTFKENQKSYDYSLFDTHLHSVTIIPMEMDDEDKDKLNERRIDEIMTRVNYYKENDDWNGLFKYLTGAIAPTIDGREDEKMALLVALLGGQMYCQPGARTRPQIHVLFIGDPGVAKTKLMKSIEYLAQRYKYASGQGATRVGLTAAIDKTEDGPKLQAGVVVLADGGIVAVDEFEKQKEADISALHEQMENQTVSVDRWNIHETLNARTTIIAAANPDAGKIVDPVASGKPIYEQIQKIPSAILSRFDLIFLIKDEPNDMKDRAMVRLMRKSRDLKYAVPMNKIVSTNIVDDDQTSTDDVKQHITFVRDWIALAKREADKHPIGITDSASKKMEEYYVRMRTKAIDQQTGQMREDLPVPITPRQYEAIDRIATAIAKARFSPSVEDYDVDVAIHLTEVSMRQTLTDEDGNIDAHMGDTGKSKARVDKTETVLRMLHSLELETNAKDGVKLTDLETKVTTESTITSSQFKAVLADMEKKSLATIVGGGKKIKTSSEGKMQIGVK